MALEQARMVRSVRSMGLAAVVIGGSAAVALAQSNSGSPEVTRGLTDPKNGGVAGTGMGTADKTSGQAKGGGSSAAPGTGMSVKGPAGQGITGQTRDLNDGGAGSGTKPIGQ